MSLKNTTSPSRRFHEAFDVYAGLRHGGRSRQWRLHPDFALKQDIVPKHTAQSTMHTCYIQPLKWCLFTLHALNENTPGRR
jgi:hypothetical protein